MSSMVAGQLRLRGQMVRLPPQNHWTSLRVSAEYEPRGWIDDTGAYLLFILPPRRTTDPERGLKFAAVPLRSH